MMTQTTAGTQRPDDGLPPFEYRAPNSLADAIALLAEKGDRARPFAGATDILVQIRNGRVRLERLVDLKDVPELTTLAYDDRAGLTLGAAVPCYRIYEDAAVQKNYPGLIDAVSIVGGTAIQGRATVGGNLCNSSPSGDTIPALIVYGAVCNIAGPQGNRSVPVEQFCTAPGRNVLGTGEVLVSLTLTPPKAHSGAHYLRFIPRNEMDIAVVGAGASVVLSDDGRSIREARVALAAVAPTPLYVEAAGQALAGQPISEDVLNTAAEAARDAARPISDMRGTAEQRRHLCGVLTKRALRGAIERAKGGTILGH